MQRRFGKAESPVVQASYRRKQLSKTSRNAFTWIFVNLILAAFFCSELFFGSLSEFLDWRHPVVWYTECSLAIWFTLSFVVDVYYYLKPVLTQSTVILSPGQKTLLGIRPTDSGFHVATSVNSVSSTSPSPSTSTPVTVSTPSSGRVTPPSRFRGSLNQSISSSSGRNQTLFLSPDLIGSPDTSLRSRHSSPRKSQFSPTECISDLGSLEEYLRQQEEQEERLHRSTSESMSPGRGQGYWSFYRQDYTPPLNVYRIATRSPELSTSRDDDDGGYSSTRVEEIWNKLGVTRGDLDHWTENCRKWICQTVLMRLANEISSVNETLCRIGCAELQIGTISLSSIRQVAVSKADQVPTLRSIIPYLEASSNQEYLVQRVRELAKGGCMGAYHWNAGGQYRGKPWEQDQLADAQLVMHVFCTYMDSRLPADPRFPDGRIFTGLHFLKTPDKPDSRKSDLCIYQSRLHPPHFKVVIEDEIYDISKGRNNLFHSILFFLHHIKTEHHGMLGRVNLGLSGVNILCIISKK